MTDAAAADPADGVLVVRGSRQARLHLPCCCGSPACGSATTPSPPARSDQAALTRTVADLATRPDPRDVRGG